MSAKVILGVSRAPFLLLTLSVLFLAFSLAYEQEKDVLFLRLFLIVICGLAAHIAVNALNEYQDFKSGLDLQSERTPFSGGSGTLPMYPEGLRVALFYGLACVILCILSGLYLALTSNLQLVLFGALGLAIVLAYTPWINRNPWLCLVAPGAGFGLIMLPGAVLALHASINLATGLAAFSVFFLVNNLLLLNQFPDIDADKRAGRLTLPIAKGQKFSLAIAAIFYLAVLVMLLLAVYLNIWPAYSLISLVLLPLPVLAIYKISKDQRNILALAANVIVSILFPVLVAVPVLVEAGVR